MKNFFKVLSIVLVFVVMGTTMIYAGGNKQAKPAAQEQYFNTWLAEEPQSLDPSRTSENVGNIVIQDIMEALTRLEPQANGGYRFVPAGAKSWSVSQDGTVYTFQLNDNFWEDGQPVTAQHYEYGIKRTANPATGSPLDFMLEGIKNFGPVNSGQMGIDELGVKAVNDKTLVITLESPIPFFMSVTASQVMNPQRPDIIAKFGDRYGSGAEFVISNGPFKVGSWTRGSNLTLLKNERYWDAANVKLDRVSFAIIPDLNTRMAAFETGEIDEARAASEEWRDRFMGMSGVNYFKVASQTINYMFFNTNDPIFKNDKIRRAFVMGIDREDLNKMAYTGLRLPTYGWVVPSISVGEYNFRSNAGDVVKEMIANQGSPRQLLLDGMRELGMGSDPSTLNITLSLAGTDQWFRDFGEYMQQTYRASLGVNLQISFSEWGIFYDNAEKGNYQIGYMSWGAYFNEPYDVLSLFVSTNNAILTGWGNAQYDDLIARASRTLDDRERLQLYIQAERIMLYDSAAASPLATSIFNDFVRDFVKGTTTLYATFGTMRHKSLYIEGRK